MIRPCLGVTILVVLGLASWEAVAAPSQSRPSDGLALLADSEPSHPGDGSAGAAAANDGKTEATAPSTSDGTEGSATTAGVPMVDAAVQTAAQPQYRLGVRARWVSVPSWLLGLFIDQSVPLNSYTIGAEFFRRRPNYDLVLGLAWQALSPADGNWLGKGNQAATDTDYIQFRSLGAVSLDAAFILRTDFNEYVSLHYGGGVGIGITTGKMLRTSDGSAGCAANPGDVVGCHPVINTGPAGPCTVGPCTEAQLNGTAGRADSFNSPSRFSDNHIPPAYPIVNIITGLDFRIPNMPGFEFKVEGGFFFPYFFLGGGATYRI